MLSQAAPHQTTGVEHSLGPFHSEFKSNLWSYSGQSLAVGI